ncbi:MAG: hypothetical protein ACKVUT_17770 [Gaiella sp.]
MTAIEIEIYAETEGERVARWRLEQLLRAGYDETAALVLADLGHVDLHIAIGLVGRGCPPETALRILV